jgi:hypothetical protein
MAEAFNLTAQLNLRGPSNIRQIVSDVKKQIGTITGEVKLKIDTSSINNTSRLNQALQSLNTNLANVSNNAQNASAAIRNFGQSVSGLGSSSAKLSTNISKAVKSTDNLGKVSTKASKNISVTRTEMEEFGRQSALAIRRFAAFSAVTGVFFSLSRAVNSGLKSFIEFDRQLVILQQVTGQNAAGLQGLQDEIAKLAVGLGVSSDSLITVATTLAQAGLSATETRAALEALAKSELAPSFDNINQTVEGSIALMRQFGISANELEKALGSVNAVSAAFAVESGDIIAAIQRTGGVFASASKGVSEGTDALNEFIAIFTSVRATTRESAETIATGLRTIFTRIQRGGTIEALKEFGVTLTDAEGKFVGAYKAIQLLSDGLNRIDPRDLRFSQIVEELGGFRQIGKVIPLIQQFATAQEALKVAQAGQGSLTTDAVKAQLSLANQITKVREEFLTLIRSLGQSDTFQTLAKGALSLASGLIKITGALKGVLPALTILAAGSGIRALTQFTGGFVGGLKKVPQGGQDNQQTIAGSIGQNIGATLVGAKTEQVSRDLDQNSGALDRVSGRLDNLVTSLNNLDSNFNNISSLLNSNNALLQQSINSLTNNTSSLDNLTNAINNLNFGGGPTTARDGGKILGFNKGGVVPGTGKGDKVPALLEPGELVLSNQTLDKYGRDNLTRMNKYAAGGRAFRGGKIKHLWSGGVADLAEIYPVIEQAWGYDDVEKLKIRDNSRFWAVSVSDIDPNLIENFQKTKGGWGDKFETLISEQYNLDKSLKRTRWDFLDFPAERAEVKFMRKGDTYDDGDGKGNTEATIAAKNYLFENSLNSPPNTPNQRVSELWPNITDLPPATVYYPENPEDFFQPTRTTDYARYNLSNPYNGGGVVQKFMAGSVGGVKQKPEPFGGKAQKSITTDKASSASKLLAALQTYSATNQTFFGEVTPEILAVKGLPKYLSQIENEYGVSSAKVLGAGGENVSFDIGDEVLKISRTGFGIQQIAEDVGFRKKQIKEIGNYQLPEGMEHVSGYRKVKTFGKLTAAIQDKVRISDTEKGMKDAELLQGKLAKRGLHWVDADGSNMGYTKDGKPTVIDGMVLTKAYMDTYLSEDAVEDIEGDSFGPMYEWEKDIKKRKGKPRFSLGGVISQFAEGGTTQRKVGYIDYDVIANPANEAVVAKGMESTGVKGPRLYADKLTELAGGWIQKFVDGGWVERMKQQDKEKLTKDLEGLRSAMVFAGDTGAYVPSYKTNKSGSYSPKEEVDSQELKERYQEMLKFVTGKELKPLQRTADFDEQELLDAITYYQGGSGPLTRAMINKDFLFIDREEEYFTDDLVNRLSAAAQYQAPQKLYSGLGRGQFNEILTDTKIKPETLTKNPSKTASRLAGKTVDFPTFLSTSTNASVAESFIGKPGALMNIDASKSKQKVIDILQAKQTTSTGSPQSRRLPGIDKIDSSKLASYDAEDEVVLNPNTRFKIKSAKLRLPANDDDEFDSAEDYYASMAGAYKDKGSKKKKPKTSEPDLTGIKLDLAAQMLNQGGMIQRFREAGAVEKTPRIRDRVSALARTKEKSIQETLIEQLKGLGGPVGVRQILGIGAGDSRTRSVLNANNIKANKGIETAKDYVNRALFVSGQSDAAEAKRIAGLTQVAIAGLLPMGYSDTNEWALSESGKTIYATIKGFDKEYLPAAQQMSRETALAARNFAENVQYTKIFGGKEKLVFDFDETLVSGVDILNEEGKPDIPRYSDRTVVEEYLKRGRLTRLGTKLKTLIDADPEFIKNTRILTARPASTVDLLAQSLQSFGLPYQASDITGVGGEGVKVPRAKAQNLAKTEKLIDDSLDNIRAVQKSKKSGFLYTEPQAKPELDELMGQGNIEGAVVEKALAILGANLPPIETLESNRAIDFPGGLGRAAQFFGLPDNIPTEIKRTLNGSAFEKARGEFDRYYKEQAIGLADGGTVPALVSNGEAYVPPKMAKKIGYGTLNRMNQADRNGMGRFAQGGISVFQGPGTGTSDSIPANLPVGSFIIREKATKALGLNQGGSVGIRNFANGGRLKFNTGGSAPGDFEAKVQSLLTEFEKAGKAAGVLAYENAKAAGQSTILAKATADAAAAAAVNKLGSQKYAEGIDRNVLMEARSRAKNDPTLIRANAADIKASRGDATVSGAATVGSNNAASVANDYLALKARLAGESVESYTKILSEQALNLAEQLKNNLPGALDKFQEKLFDSSRDLQNINSRTYTDNKTKQTDISQVRESIASDLRQILGDGFGGDFDKITSDIFDALQRGVTPTEAFNVSSLNTAIKDISTDQALLNRAVSTIATQNKIQPGQLRGATLPDFTNKLNFTSLQKRVDEAGKRFAKTSLLVSGFGGVLSNLISATESRSSAITSAAIGSGTATYGAVGAGFREAGSLLTGIAPKIGGSLGNMLGGAASLVTGPFGMIAAAGIGLAAAFKDAHNAAREFDKQLNNKKIELSLNRINTMFDEFSKDMTKKNILDDIATELNSAISAALSNINIDATVPKMFWTNILDVIFSSSQSAAAQRSTVLEKQGIGAYLESTSFFGSGARGLERNMFELAPQLAAQQSASLKPQADNAFKLFEQRLRSGGSVDDIMKELKTAGGGVSQFATAIARSNPIIEEQIIKTQARADLNDVEKQQIIESIIAREAEKQTILNTTATMRAMEFEKLNKGIAKFVNSLERIYQNMEMSINKASFDIQKLSQSAELSSAALSGEAKAGQTNLDAINVLQNRRAYSPEQQNQAVDLAGSFFGSTSPAISALLNIGDKLESSILQTINRTRMAEPGATNERVLASIRSNLDKTLSDLQIPDNLVPKLSEQIKNALKDITTSGDLDSVSFEQIAEAVPGLSRQIESARRAQEVAVKALEFYQNQLTEYSNSMNTMIDLQMGAYKDFARASDILINSTNELAKAFGREISLREVINNTLNRTKNQTGGATNPTDITRNIFNLENSRKILETASENASNKGPTGKDEFVLMQDRLRKNNFALRQNYDALKNLAENTDIASAALAKIQEIQQRRQAGANLIEKLVTSNPEELAKLNAAMGRLNNNMQGIANRGTTNEQRSESLQLFNQIAPLLGDGATQNAIRANVLESQLLESGMGINPMFAQVLDSLRNPEGDPEMQEAISVYKYGNQLQSEANARLGEIKLLMEENTAENAAQKLKVAIAGAKLTFDQQLLSEINKGIIDLNELVGKRGPAAAGLAAGGVVYASAGQAIDFAPKGTDTVPAMLTPGEFVVNRKATRNNLPLLQNINSGKYSKGGKVSYLADGGIVPGDDWASPYATTVADRSQRQQTRYETKDFFYHIKKLPTNSDIDQRLMVPATSYASTTKPELIIIPRTGPSYDISVPNIFNAKPGISSDMWTLNFSNNNQKSRSRLPSIRSYIAKYLKDPTAIIDTSRKKLEQDDVIQYQNQKKYNDIIDIYDNHLFEKDNMSKITTQPPSLDSTKIKKDQTKIRFNNLTKTDPSKFFLLNPDRGSIIAPPSKKITDAATPSDPFFSSASGDSLYMTPSSVSNNAIDYAINLSSHIPDVHWLENLKKDQDNLSKIDINTKKGLVETAISKQIKTNISLLEDLYNDKIFQAKFTRESDLFYPSGSASGVKLPITLYNQSKNKWQEKLAEFNASINKDKTFAWNNFVDLYKYKDTKFGWEKDNGSRRDFAWTSADVDDSIVKRISSSKNTFGLGGQDLFGNITTATYGEPNSLQPFFNYQKVDKGHSYDSFARQFIPLDQPYYVISKTNDAQSPFDVLGDNEKLYIPANNWKRFEAILKSTQSQYDNNGQLLTNGTFKYDFNNPMGSFTPVSENSIDDQYRSVLDKFINAGVILPHNGLRNTILEAMSFKKTIEDRAAKIAKGKAVDSAKKGFDVTLDKTETWTDAKKVGVARAVYDIGKNSIDIKSSKPTDMQGLLAVISELNSKATQLSKNTDQQAPNQRINSPAWLVNDAYRAFFVELYKGAGGKQSTPVFLKGLGLPIDNKDFDPNTPAPKVPVKGRKGKTEKAYLDYMPASKNRVSEVINNIINREMTLKSSGNLAASITDQEQQDATIKAGTARIQGQESTQDIVPQSYKDIFNIGLNPRNVFPDKDFRTNKYLNTLEDLYKTGTNEQGDLVFDIGDKKYLTAAKSIEALKVWYGTHQDAILNTGLDLATKEQNKKLLIPGEALDRQSKKLYTTSQDAHSFLTGNMFGTLPDASQLSSLIDLEIEEPVRKAKGGIIYANKGTLVNFQPRGTDTVPAMLTPGEFVVNRAATQKNLPLLQSINSGSKGYSNGGVVYAADGGAISTSVQSFAPLSDYDKLINAIVGSSRPNIDSNIQLKILNNLTNKQISILTNAHDRLGDVTGLLGAISLFTGAMAKTTAPDSLNQAGTDPGKLDNYLKSLNNVLGFSKQDNSPGNSLPSVSIPASATGATSIPSITIPIPDWLPITIAAPDWLPIDMSLSRPDWIDEIATVSIPTPIWLEELKNINITSPDWLPIFVDRPSWLDELNDLSNIITIEPAFDIPIPLEKFGCCESKDVSQIPKTRLEPTNNTTNNDPWWKTPVPIDISVPEVTKATPSRNTRMDEVDERLGVNTPEQSRRYWEEEERAVDDRNRERAEKTGQKAAQVVVGAQGATSAFNAAADLATADSMYDAVSSGAGLVEGISDTASVLKSVRNQAGVVGDIAGVIGGGMKLYDAASSGKSVLQPALDLGQDALSLGATVAPMALGGTGSALAPIAAGTELIRGGVAGYNDDSKDAKMRSKTENTILGVLRGDATSGNSDLAKSSNTLLGTDIQQGDYADLALRNLENQIRGASAGYALGNTIVPGIGGAVGAVAGQSAAVVGDVYAEGSLYAREAYDASQREQKTQDMLNQTKTERQVMDDAGSVVSAPKSVSEFDYRIDVISSNLIKNLARITDELNELENLRSSGASSYDNQDINQQIANKQMEAQNIRSSLQNRAIEQVDQENITLFDLGADSPQVQSKMTEFNNRLALAIDQLGLALVSNLDPKKINTNHIDSVASYQKGGLIYANNGMLIPYQPKGTDTVPAMLTPGEFVVNRAATQQNLPLLKAINNGSQAYANGGVVYAAEGVFVGSKNKTQKPTDYVKLIKDFAEYVDIDGNYTDENKMPQIRKAIENIRLLREFSDYANLSLDDENALHKALTSENRPQLDDSWDPRDLERIWWYAQEYQEEQHTLKNLKNLTFRTKDGKHTTYGWPQNESVDGYTGDDPPKMRISKIDPATGEDLFTDSKMFSMDILDNPSIANAVSYGSNFPDEWLHYIASIAQKKRLSDFTTQLALNNPSWFTPDLLAYNGLENIEYRFLDNNPNLAPLFNQAKLEKQIETKPISQSQSLPVSVDTGMKMFSQIAERRWEDSTGQYSTIGTLQELMGAKVRISKLNGKTTSMPVSQLSAADQDYLNNLQPIRDWTDDTGKYKTQARIVGVEKQGIMIQKSDGSTKNIPINRLSKQDQDYLNNQYADILVDPTNFSNMTNNVAQADNRGSSQSSSNRSYYGAQAGVPTPMFIRGTPPAGSDETMKEFMDRVQKEVSNLEQKDRQRLIFLYEMKGLPILDSERQSLGYDYDVGIDGVARVTVPNLDLDERARRLRETPGDFRNKYGTAVDIIKDYEARGTGMTPAGSAYQSMISAVEDMNSTRQSTLFTSDRSSYRGPLPGSSDDATWATYLNMARSYRRGDTDRYEYRRQKLGDKFDQNLFEKAQQYLDRQDSEKSKIQKKEQQYQQKLQQEQKRIEEVRKSVLLSTGTALSGPYKQLDKQTLAWMNRFNWLAVNKWGNNIAPRIDLDEISGGVPNRKYFDRWKKETEAYWYDLNAKEWYDLTLGPIAQDRETRTQEWLNSRKLGSKRYKQGGVVYASNGTLVNFQPRGTDTVPAMLTPGEFVINRASTQKYKPVLEAINNGHYNRGGIVNYLKQGGYIAPKYFETAGPVGSSNPAQSFDFTRYMNGLVGSLASSISQAFDKALNNLKQPNNASGGVSSNSQELASIDNFVNRLNNIANILSNIYIPPQITITGKHDVVVTINGDTVLNQLRPDIAGIVVSAIKGAFTDLKAKNPENNTIDFDIDIDPNKYR